VPAGVVVRYCTPNTPWDENLLTEAERALADRFGAPRRASFLLGRTLLRAAAGEVLGCAPQHVPLVELPNGALALPETGWHVNLTHTHGAAGVVLARQRVGIDAEHMRARDPALWGRILAPGEMRPQPAGWSEVERLILTWAAKEAALKATGVGLRLGAAAARLTSGLDGTSFVAETPEGRFEVAATRHAGAVWAVAWEAP
jgi:phosphopantetheinyl transferase